MSYTFSIPFQKPLVYHLILFFPRFFSKDFFWFSPCGPPQRVSTYCFFFGFLLVALPKESPHIVFFFLVFPMFILVFSVGPSPKNLNNYFFSCFSSLRPFPKDDGCHDNECLEVEAKNWPLFLEHSV